MFSNRTVNPSPNRTSIKEANDHLQLLHQRVVELEKTTQEQAEALVKKDELMQATLKEITEVKDAEIHNLAVIVEQLKERVRKLEQAVRDKDQQIEHLNHRCTVAEDVASYTPAVEKLLSAMKKIPMKSKLGSSRSKLRSNRTHSGKTERRSTTSMDGNHPNDGPNAIDGHVSIPNQSFVDLRIGRSFNINSNFSVSEDDEPSEIL